MQFPEMTTNEISIDPLTLSLSKRSEDPACCEAAAGQLVTLFH